MRTIICSLFYDDDDETAKAKRHEKRRESRQNVIEFLTRRFLHSNFLGNFLSFSL